MLKVIFAIVVFLSCWQTNAASYTFYDDPFQLSNYVTQPDALIVRAMDGVGWQHTKSSDNTIRGELNHKDYKLVVDVHFDNNKIWFNEVSKEYFGCKRKPCKVKQRHIDRWRLSLRRHIALEITKLAEKDAMTKTIETSK